jgi:hypothetical protein
VGVAGEGALRRARPLAEELLVRSIADAEVDAGAQAVGRRDRDAGVGAPPIAAADP